MNCSKGLDCCSPVVLFQKSHMPLSLLILMVCHFLVIVLKDVKLFQSILIKLFLWSVNILSFFNDMFFLIDSFFNDMLRSTNLN